MFLVIFQKILKSKKKNDSSKTIGGDRFLVKKSNFAFLVCDSHKEPIELFNLDSLYLKSYFEF